MRLDYAWNKDLCEYFGLSKEDFENKTIKELNLLDDQMKKEKIEDQKKRNKEDEDFIRIVKKFFTPYTYLLQFFNEEDVILACCNHLTVRNITEEYKTKGHVLDKNAEFIANRYEYMPQYDKYGRELAKRNYEPVNVFRISSRYQGLRHGDVILELLYKKYPQLKQYDFSAYEYHDYYKRPYEIYAKNKIYTPFAALINKDIEAIKKRNIDYGKSYNYGEFTEAKVAHRLVYNQDFFDTISSLE